MAGASDFGPRLSAPLLFLAAFLVVTALGANLANLSAPVSDSPPAAGTSSSAGLAFPASIRLLLAWIISVGFLVTMVGIGLSALRHRRIPRFWSQRSVLALLLGIALLVLLIQIWPSVAQQFQAATPTQDPLQNENVTAGSTDSQEGDASSGIAGVVGLSAAPAVLIAVAIATAAFFLTSFARAVRPRASGAPAETVADDPGRSELARAVGDAIDDLSLGMDPRSVVLRCYATMCGLLARGGLDRMDPLTPREVREEALARFRLSPDSIGPLTAIFEEARYSEHPIGAPDRERALLALAKVRGDLGA